MSFMLKLSDERGEQLRQIAAAKNTTIPELIAGFIRSEIAAKTIPATVPGIDVAADGPSITIRAKAFEVVIPANEGPTLAEVLKGAAGVASDPERKLRWTEGVAALSGIKVKRMAQGVRLVSPITGQEYTLAMPLAADLADQINPASK